MSKRAVEFAEEWIRENVNAGPYDPGDAVVLPLVEQLVQEAGQAGISREEIEEDMGDLEDLVENALESATDNEVARLAAKDD